MPKKLKEYNFDAASIEWIQSYIGERKQFVMIESKTSDLLDCEDQYWLEYSISLIQMICQTEEVLALGYLKTW